MTFLKRASVRSAGSLFLTKATEQGFLSARSSAGGITTWTRRSLQRWLKINSTMETMMSKQYKKPMKWKIYKWRCCVLLDFISEVAIAIPDDEDPMTDLGRVREKALDLIDEFIKVEDDEWRD